MLFGGAAPAWLSMASANKRSDKIGSCQKGGTLYILWAAVAWQIPRAKTLPTRRWPVTSHRSTESLS
jgi:hypothetical protein